MADNSASPIHIESGSGGPRGSKVDAADLCYSIVVTKNGKRKMQRLLKNVSFSLEPGNLCALMGPSGAGKSTLLDLLAGRKLVGTWSGEVYIDDLPRTKYFGRETAYVLQDDVHMATLTVEETIYYSAWTKLPEGTSVADRKRRVEELLEMMDLKHIRDSYVGSAMTKGISGGQLKRLSIAVEIVSLPRLIFLDEPTSGLDSAIAFEVMSTVRNFVTSDRTCISTIHQPSREIFSLFDKLVLVSGGRLIFFGAAADAVVYFTQPELGYKFEGGYRNPAEFVIEVSCAQRLPEGMKIPRQPEELEVLYKSSRFYRPTSLAARAELRSGEEDDADPFGLDYSRYFVTSRWTQFRMLMERSWVAKIRDMPEFYAQIGKNTVVAVLLGIVFLGKGDVSSPFYENGALTSDASAVISSLFMVLIYCMMTHIQSIPYLCGCAQLYKRELASSAYGPFPYFISQLLCFTPIQFAYHFLFIMIVYWLVDYQSNAGVFFYFTMTTFVGGMIAFISAMSLAANTPSEAIALAIFPAQFLVFTTFCGFMIKLDDIPIYWKWISFLTYPRWIFEGLMINQWHNYDTDDYSGPENGSGDILEMYSFKDIGLGDVIWISLLFALFFAATLYFGLLPPINRLIKVGNATDVVTVMSRNPSVVDSISSASITSKGRQGVSTKRSTSNDLKQNLMSGGGHHLEESMVVEDPLLEHQPMRSVESYRISSGVVDRARGCRLVFRDVHYTVTDKADSTKQTTLLKGVTGRAMPGEMVALMGASGAGKSTLLDVLAQRKSTGTITGEITYNGSQEMSSCAYVMQDNVHMGILTVRESIRYAAELRLNELMSSEAKARRVQKIIDMLGLQEVANTILGTSDIRGVSGGQLKRVSIGVEIVNLPNLMFLDEPTTGLDSSISLEVMSAVRNLANQNRTVICTIHQPSEDTFALFDTLLLLAEGRVIYFGPTASVVDYFVQSPYQFVCNVGANPADFVVSVAGSFLHASDGRTISGGELAAYYSTSDRAQSAAEVLPDDYEIPHRNIPENPLLKTAEQTEEPEPKGMYRTGLYHQLKTLLHRRVLVMQKDPMPTVGPIMRELMVGIFYGSVFWQLDTGDNCDSSCYSDRLSLLFLSIMLMLMGHLDTISNLLSDRLVFYRERGAKAYGPLAYYLSLFVPLMPIMILNVLFFSMTAYPMCGLRSGGTHFFYFFFFMLMANYVGMFMAFTMAALASSTIVALSFYPSALFYNMVYAGFMVYIPSLPDWQGKWMPYLSFYRFAFQGMMLNEFHNNDDLPQAHDYIQQLGFDFISVSGCAGVLFLFLLFFSSTLYLALRYVDFEER